MKIKWGALVVDGRGKLGGHVASKNRGGAFLRTKVTPTNPSSFFQATVRAIFASITTGWSLLTDAQRISWNNAVSDFASTDIFGDLKNPSGKNLHQKLNQNLLLAGGSLINNAPAKMSFPEEVLESATIEIGVEQLSLLGISIESAVKVVVSGTPVLTNGTTNAKNRFRQIFAASGNVIDPSDVYTAYVYRFGTPSVGDNIQIGVQYVLSSGQKSPMQTVTASIDA